VRVNVKGQDAVNKLGLHGVVSTVADTGGVAIGETVDEGLIGSKPCRSWTTSL